MVDVERDGSIGLPDARSSRGVSERMVEASCDVVAVLDFDSDLTGDYDALANEMGERLSAQLRAIGCPPVGPMWTKSVGGQNNGFSSVAVMIGFRTEEMPKSIHLDGCVVDTQALGPRKEAFVVVEVEDSDGSEISRFLDHIETFRDSDGTIRTQPIFDSNGNYQGLIECSAIIEWM